MYGIFRSCSFNYAKTYSDCFLLSEINVTVMNTVYWLFFLLNKNVIAQRCDYFNLFTVTMGCIHL